MSFDKVINTANAYSNPVSAVINFAGRIFSSIRAGAREANQIVPVQNQVGDLLAQVNQRIQDPATTVEELQAMRQTVIDAGDAFNQFTRQSTFTDGRASRQARLTIFPLLDGTDGDGNRVSVDAWNNPVNGGTIGSIDRAIAERGGSLAPAGSGDSGPLVIAAGLIGALLLK